MDTQQLINKVQTILSKNQVYKSELENKELEVTQTKQLLAEQTKEQILLSKGVDTFNLFSIRLSESISKHLEDLVNEGLALVFNNDKTQYQLKIELVSRKNNNQCNLYLLKTEDGSVLETRLSDNGFGIQSFIGLIFRFYFILQNNLPRFLFIDEGLTAISVDHFPALKQFLDQLCEKYNFSISLIAHDSDLFQLGDYFYLVHNGTITNEVPVFEGDDVDVN